MSAPARGAPAACMLRGAWLLVFLFALLPCATRAAPPLAIVDANVVDVLHGRAIGPRTVLIVDGRIAAIGTRASLRLPADARTVDGRGKFLIPGLVDLHVHLFNNSSHRPPNDWMFPLFVANGVTGVREMLTTPDELPQVKQWRAGVTLGTLIAPHVLAAGVSPQAASDAGARAAVRDAARAGADFIKVFSEVTPDRWRAILDEAKSQHLPVDGHVPAAVAWLAAARAGQRTSEHLMQAYEACSSREAEWLRARRDLDRDAAVALRDAQEAEVLRSFDVDTCARAAKAVAATGQAQVPTIVLEYFDPARPRADFTSDPRWPLLRPDEQQRWHRYLAPTTSESDRALAERRWDVTCRIVRALHDAGATVLPGTDAPMPLVYPGYALHDELEQLVACGLSTSEALRAATAGAARLLGRRDFGQVQRGLRADLVLLDADPLRDIRNSRRIAAVVLAGRLLEQAQLEAALSGAAAHTRAD